MIGRRSSDWVADDEPNFRAHYLTQRPPPNIAYRYGNDPFFSRAESQQGSPRRLLLVAGGVLVVFIAAFGLGGGEGALGLGGGGGGTDKAAEELCPEGHQLERHDHEEQHGDVCRDAKGDFLCPESCSPQTSGNAPYCSGSKGNNKACRVPRSRNTLEYRCDVQGGGRGVCVKATVNPEYKGRAKYRDATCDGQCGGASRKRFKCKDDVDCSLAGICDVDQGICTCDPWAEGEDCSYLRFAPVDPAKVGYLHEKYSSWGGSVQVGQKDGMYHMFVSEIICGQNDLRDTRCGLGAWQTNSQVVHAVSGDPAGPYTRLGVILPTEHHNPTVQVSPVDRSWNLFSISGPSGPIEVAESTDDGYTWTETVVVSKMQNPGPVMNVDGSVTMFYRGDGGKLPSPTCSSEYIGSQACPSRNEPCVNKKGKRIFDHTAEDPMVFLDHRGNYHMLMNALPYMCVPKTKQGGHAWSRDGITWSEPRVGAYNTTVQLSDGSTVTCERRERPQMMMNPKRPGVPLALVSALTGCPAKSFGPSYRGGDDSLTLVQMMEQSGSPKGQ